MNYNNLFTLNFNTQQIDMLCWLLENHENSLRLNETVVYEFKE